MKTKVSANNLYPIALSLVKSAALLCLLVATACTNMLHDGFRVKDEKPDQITDITSIPMLVLVPLRTTFAPGETFDPSNTPPATPRHLVVYLKDYKGTMTQLESSRLSITLTKEGDPARLPLPYTFTDLSHTRYTVGVSHDTGNGVLSGYYFVEVLPGYIPPAYQDVLIAVTQKTSYYTGDGIDNTLDLSVFFFDSMGALTFVPPGEFSLSATGQDSATNTFNAIGRQTVRVDYTPPAGVLLSTSYFVEVIGRQTLGPPDLALDIPLGIPGDAGGTIYVSSRGHTQTGYRITPPSGVAPDLYEVW